MARCSVEKNICNWCFPTKTKREVYTVSSWKAWNPTKLTRKNYTFLFDAKPSSGATQLPQVNWSSNLSLAQTALRAQSRGNGTQLSPPARWSNFLLKAHFLLFTGFSHVLTRLFGMVLESVFDTLWILPVFEKGEHVVRVVFICFVLLGRLGWMFSSELQAIKEMEEHQVIYLRLGDRRSSLKRPFTGHGLIKRNGSRKHLQYEMKEFIRQPLGQSLREEPTPKKIQRNEKSTSTSQRFRLPQTGAPPRRSRCHRSGRRCRSAPGPTWGARSSVERLAWSKCSVLWFRLGYVLWVQTRGLRCLAHTGLGVPHGAQIGTPGMGSSPQALFSDLRIFNFNWFLLYGLYGYVCFFFHLWDPNGFFRVFGDACFIGDFWVFGVWGALQSRTFIWVWSLQVRRPHPHLSTSTKGVVPRKSP